MSETLMAHNRFGLGARTGGGRRLGDPRGWLQSQLQGDPPQLTASLPTADELRQAQDAFVAAATSRDQEGVRRATRDMVQLAGREMAAVLSTRVASERPFAERWVAFWSNHLCVSTAGKARVAALAGQYEREAIRPHVFGAFEELLLASARHPAMLVYLDNAQSVGPNSAAARLGRRARRPRTPGLNENYARELLELHTVGVNGGYTQRDVEQLARILTGWTLEGGSRQARAGGPTSFRFRPALHEPGDKRVLGVTYREDGEDEGVRVVRDLARRAETARFCCTKLARHFIADEPPPAAVERLSAEWMATGGNLRRVASALVALDAAWDPAHRKFRTPQDWLVAVFRAVGAPSAGPTIPALLRQLRHPLWAPPSPKGYGDLAADWADPDSLMNRAELARSIGGRLARGGADIDPAGLAALMTGVADEASPALQALLDDRAIPAAERFALAFAGPAFQWR